MDLLPVIMSVAGALLLVAVVCVVLAVRGPLAEIDLRVDEIAIRPRGLNRIWSASRSLLVPRAVISSVYVREEPADIDRGVRRRGGWLPGVLAGFYGSGWHRSFWLAKRHRPAVVLDLSWTLRRIVVDVADADRVVAALRVG